MCFFREQYTVMTSFIFCPWVFPVGVCVCVREGQNKLSFGQHLERTYIRLWYTYNTYCYVDSKKKRILPGWTRTETLHNPTSASNTIREMFHHWQFIKLEIFVDIFNLPHSVVAYKIDSLSVTKATNHTILAQLDGTTNLVAACPHNLETMKGLIWTMPLI